MRTQVLKRESEKMALIERLSAQGRDLAVYYDEAPDASKLRYEQLPDGAFLVKAPFDYECLERWLYCGNWQAVHPVVSGFVPFNSFRASRQELDDKLARLGITLLIDSFADDIEWNVVQS